MVVRLLGGIHRDGQFRLQAAIALQYGQQADALQLRHSVTQHHVFCQPSCGTIMNPDFQPSPGVKGRLRGREGDQGNFGQAENRKQGMDEGEHGERDAISRRLQQSRSPGREGAFTDGGFPSGPAMLAGPTGPDRFQEPRLRSITRMSISATPVSWIRMDDGGALVSRVGKSSPRSAARHAFAKQVFIQQVPFVQQELLRTAASPK